MGKPLPKKLVAAVLERDGGLCVLRLAGCMGEASCADHRRSRGSGGAKHGVLDQMSNLIAACGPCNGAKEDSHGETRALLEARGVIVTAGRTHAHEAQKAREKAVWYPDGRVFYLNDDGTRDQISDDPY